MIVVNAPWLIFFVLIGWVFHYHWKRLHLYQLAAKIPGPTAYPLIGSAYLFFRFEDITHNMFLLLKRYGPILKLWMFNVLFVVVTKPKHVQVVLNECLEKDKRYNIARDFFGNSLLTAPANVWKVNRRIINPTFNQKILESFMGVFVDQSSILVEQLKRSVKNNETFNVELNLTRCALDIFFETAMGVSVEIQTNPDSKLLKQNKKVGKLIMERSMRVWLHPDIIFKYTRRGRELKDALNYIHSFTGNIVSKRIEEFRNKKQEETFDDNSRKPFLEHLLELGDKMTFVQLCDEVDLFIAAGTETIASAVGYTLVCLGIYQDIQEKVVEELDEVFDKTDRRITLDDLPKLNYTERVLKETMRIYPPVPFVARSVTEDTDLGDVILPAGSSVGIAAIGVHRDPEIWPDPMKFDPERFLPEEVAKRHPYSYIPFSGGPRNCIGGKYAMMSMKVILLTILRSYKVDTEIKPENIRLSNEIVSRMIGGCNISIKKRQ